MCGQVLRLVIVQGKLRAVDDASSRFEQEATEETESNVPGRLLAPPVPSVSSVSSCSIPVCLDERCAFITLAGCLARQGLELWGLGAGY